MMKLGVPSGFVLHVYAIRNCLVYKRILVTERLDKLGLKNLNQLHNSNAKCISLLMLLKEKLFFSGEDLTEKLC